jgi:putative addiction module component (TIGR02574 family)
LPVEIPRRTRYNDGVPLTVEQIIEETRDWPSEKVEELIERLAENPHSSDPKTEAAWKAEINRRVEEIQSGQVQGIPLDKSLARIRKIAGL